MKKKDFEMIIPAYDALEAELEEILGGGCTNKCKGFLCNVNQGGDEEGETSNDCLPLGSVTPLDEFTKCCEGLTGMVTTDNNGKSYVTCMTL